MSENTQPKNKDTEPKQPVIKDEELDDVALDQVSGGNNTYEKDTKRYDRMMELLSSIIKKQ